MIISSSLLLFFFFFIFLDANEFYQLGIINHHIQWHIHCPDNNTRILNPPFGDQPLIPYQCPYRSLPIDIVPIEIDFTFVCRLDSRLLWIIIDVYRYNDWLWSENIESTNISIQLNGKLELNESKSETTTYLHRLITINAYYIPFENLEIIADEIIEIFIRINRCQFSIRENATWNDIMLKQCQTIQSHSLQVQYAQCDFFPKLIPIDDNTTTIPDFHVSLSIDESQRTIETTTPARLPDYYLLFNEHYKHILSTLAVLARASNLITFIFIFTILIFILLVIFFVYTLCYHYHIRSRQKSSLLI